MVICLEPGADSLHVVRPVPLPFESAIISSLIKVQNVFIKVFLVPVYPGWSVILPCLTEPEVIAALWVHVVWQDFVHVSK